MNESIQRLTAGLSPRRPLGRGEFTFDVKVLRDRLLQLPLANLAATANQLADLLVLMNSLALDPQVRLDALELLRKPVREAVHTLDHHLRMDSVPLSSAKLQIAHRAQAFEAAMADGYALTLEGLVGPAGKIPFLKAKAVALAATRALQHAGARLGQAYLGYEAPPPGAWRRMHNLYRVAMTLGIETRASRDPLLGQADVSPRDAYAHALLLTLCNPYRFSQREIGELWELTRAWAPYCALGGGTAAFIVNVESDSSLGDSAEEQEVASADRLAFDPAPATRLVRGEFERLPPGVDVAFRLRGGPRIAVSRAFAERVMSSWSGNDAERGHARLAADHQLDAVVGLHALHHMLAGGEDFDTFVRRVRGQAIALGERETASWATQPMVARPGVCAVQVLDQSLGGYQLAFKAGNLARVKVGEIIGLSTPTSNDEDRTWMVGVVRWIHSDSEGGINAGVELVARRAQPVGLASFDANGAVRPPMRAVLLVERDHDAALTLLAPQLFDHQTREVELTRPADPLDWQAAPSVVRLNSVQIIDASGAYQRVIIGRACTEHEIAGAMPETSSAPKTPAES